MEDIRRFSRLSQALVHFVIDRASLFTMEYQVFQYVTNLSISEQFESILVTFLPRIGILPFRSDGLRCME